LTAAETKYRAMGHRVFGFVADLSDPAAVPVVLAQIVAEHGPVAVAHYNAVVIGLPYSASPAELAAATNVNVVSMHVAFNTLLPAFQAARAGVFLLTGGGFGKNGAWAAPYGAGFGAAAKAYYRNFAESANATFAKDGVHVVAVSLNAMLHGSALFPDAASDPAANDALRARIAAAFYSAATELSADVAYVDVA
jgi:NAD(P)-dependent dehydrogenase (short-subunit alcohol dehydrogenase family)